MASELEFVVDATLARVYVQDIPAFCSVALAPNINQVTFANGKGEIVYNDRQPLPEPFTDPSPYQPSINNWLMAMASSAPALTLAQAISVKQYLVSAIYDVKRQAPVQVNTTAGNLFWDASDVAIEQYAMLGPYVLNGALASVATVLNNAITALNQDSASGNSLVSQYNALITAFNTLLGSAGTTGFGGFEVASDGYYNAVQILWAAAGNGPISPGNPVRTTIPGSQPGFGASFAAGVSGASVSTPSLSLIPIGGSTPVSLTSADVGSIMSAINTQQLHDQTVLISKRAAIAALTTIPAIVAYDATAGW